MPGSPKPVLLLSADPASAELVSTVLTGIGYTVDVVTDPDQAVARAHAHVLVMLDLVSGAKSATQVCREIRETDSGTSIPILAVAQNDDVEERIRFLEARVEALLLRFRRARELGTDTTAIRRAVAPQARRIAAVFSPKGGVGTTTIATNLGVVQALTSPERAVILDLDLQFGQVATHLNVDPSRTVIELLADDAVAAEADLLRTYSATHETGLHVIAAPPRVEQADTISPAEVGRLIDMAVAAYDYVVIDAGHGLDARTMAIFDKADAIIIPVVADISSLKAVHSLMEYLNAHESIATKTRFVLNNIFAREILKLRDVELALGTRVSGALPYDPFLYLKAVNEGIPVVTGAPRSPATDRLMKLAAGVFGLGDVEIGDSPEPERKPRRIGGLLRRSSSRG